MWGVLAVLLALCAPASAQVVNYGGNIGNQAGKLVFAPPPSAAPSFSLTYEATPNVSDSTNTTVSLGTPTYGASANVVLVLYCFRSITVTISAMSLNGVAGTHVPNTAVNDGTTISGDIWYVVAPGGSSGALSTTFTAHLDGGGGSNLFGALYNVKTTTTTPASNASPTANGNNNSSLAVTINIPSGGGAAAAMCTSNGTALSSWTNATSDASTGGGGNPGSIVGHNTSNSGSTTITGTLTGSDALTLGAVAMSP